MTFKRLGDIGIILSRLCPLRILSLLMELFTGERSFNSQNVISTAADGARSVFASDVDRDGDLDVLSASAVDDPIAWYEKKYATPTLDAIVDVTIEEDAPEQTVNLTSITAAGVTRIRKTHGAVHSVGA